MHQQAVDTHRYAPRFVPALTAMRPTHHAKIGSSARKSNHSSYCLFAVRYIRGSHHENPGLRPGESTRDQDLTGQIDDLRAAGAGSIYREKISGARADRPGAD